MVLAANTPDSLDGVDTNELRQFSQTFWVNSCVTTLLDEITSLDWDVTPLDDQPYAGKKDAIEKAKKFLSYPNKNRESWTTIQRAVLKDILELDAGIIVKVYTRDSYDWENIEPKSGAPMLKPRGERQLTELYARDGASFLMEADKFGYVAGYWQYSYQIPAHPIWFDRDEICYIKRNQRSMSVYGYAPTQAILDLVKSLYYSTIYNKKFFEETAIPDGVLSVLNMDEQGKKELLAQWSDSFKGQPHKFAVVNQDIKWLPLTALQRELEFLETQTWYYKLVIGMYGLTPAELGITDDVNKSTSTTQAELSRRKGIRPLLKLMEKYINEEIMPDIAEGLQFQYIYDDPVEMNKKLANWEMMLNMHVKTPNEIREEMGLEPIEGGDEMYDRFGLGTQPSNKFGTQGKEEGEGKGDEEGEKLKKNLKIEKKYKVDNESKYAHERFDLSKADLLSDSGSDRSAYEMPDGKILKIVKTARGLAQNLGEGLNWKLLPKMYEKGKDYVIVEKVNRDDKRTNEMLRGLQGYRGDDWAKKTPGILREFKRLSKEYPGCEFEEVVNHDLIFGDFKKAKNWGWKEERPYLLDAGTIMPEILDKNFVNQFKELWFEIVKIRREARRKGNAVLTKSFDLIKSKYKKMSYEELIAEHKKLVAVLESQDPDELDDELKEQKAELEQYIAEYEKLDKSLFEKEEKIEWITVNGKHIPIKPGQTKDEAVHENIEGFGEKEDRKTPAPKLREQENIEIPKEEQVYNSPLKLTEDTWKYTPREGKIKLLSELGYDESWADTKTIPELVQRGGGMIAAKLKEMSVKLLELMDNELKINWSDKEEEGGKSQFEQEKIEGQRRRMSPEHKKEQLKIASEIKRIKSEIDSGKDPKEFDDDLNSLDGNIDQETAEKIGYDKIKEEIINIIQSRKVNKGINDGQYYRDPPEVIGNNPSVVYQPQNMKLIEESKKPRKIEDSKKNKEICPYCGHPTLSEEPNEQSIENEQKRFRCAFCHAYLEQQDLMDNEVLEQLESLMTGNNQTKPVSIPNWSPKACACETCKSLGEGMLVKDYVGFDYYKSKDDVIRYILSKEYEDLLKKFFKDLDIEVIYKIKMALIEGVQENKSITEVANMINKFLKDKDRSMVIARNELMRSVNEGNKMRMKGSGVRKVIWLTAKDERTCPICKKLDHKVFDIDKVKNPIDVHVNCRCTYTDYVEI